MARHIWQMKLTDLHGQATQIAQEFKTIETSFGTHCLSKLLPLVLGVLERLELYIDEYEKLQTENAKINLKLSGQDHFDSASSGLDNYVVVVAPSDSEALKTLQRAKPSDLLLRSPSKERASPAPVVFSLHTPEAPATPLSATHATTQFTYAAETPIEQQLQKARDELAATQLTVMQLQEENLQLMTKLNQLSKSSTVIEGEYQQQVETAQHYKADLLTVLMEKAELKQDMMTIQDELDVTKRQLKECISRLSSQQQQLDLLDT
ncbi:hypothetical protein EMCRGX_G024942 [Ephydatia muelleri]